jgi:hypothetical protein
MRRGLRKSNAANAPNARDRYCDFAFPLRHVTAGDEPA